MLVVMIIIIYYAKENKLIFQRPASIRIVLREHPVKRSQCNSDLEGKVQGEKSAKIHIMQDP